MISPTGIIPEELMYPQKVRDVMQFISTTPGTGTWKRQLLQGWAKTVGVKVSHVQVHDRGMGLAFSQLMHDGPRNYVSWGEFCCRVVLRHEALQFRVAQQGAFAAQSFRKQEARSAFDAQCRRVKLKELHVA